MHFYDAVLPFIGGLACHLTRKYGRRGPESRVFYKPPEHRRNEGAQGGECSSGLAVPKNTRFTAQRETRTENLCVYVGARCKKNGPDSNPTLPPPPTHQLSVLRWLCKKKKWRARKQEFTFQSFSNLIEKKKGKQTVLQPWDDAGTGGRSGEKLFHGFFMVDIVFERFGKEKS